MCDQPSREETTPEKPPYVPFHEADLPRIPPGALIQKCRALTLPGERELLVGQVKDDEGGGLFIRISRPIKDGEQHSRLEFGLSIEAAQALHDLLCWQLSDLRP